MLTTKVTNNWLTVVFDCYFSSVTTNQFIEEQKTSDIYSDNRVIWSQIHTNIKHILYKEKEKKPMRHTPHKFHFHKTKPILFYFLWLQHKEKEPLQWRLAICLRKQLKTEPKTESCLLDLQALVHGEEAIVMVIMNIKLLQP